MRKLKSIILGWSYFVAAHLPPRLSIWIVNRSWPIKRPVLDYIEFHLADHCNLNCAGCSHFSPYADRKLADIESVRRDFTRLKTLFSNIRHMRIMGGEPLLHPDAAAFVRLVRETFPKCKITFVTNGIKLLDDKDGNVDSTLSSLREQNVGLDWTLYPPLEKRRDEIVARCKASGVRLRISENDSFMARMKPDGDVSPAMSFSWCRKLVYCPILDNGRIYPCAQSHYVRYYNRAAGTSILEDGGIDIHSASAREILLYLMRPSRACAYCDAGARHFAWKSNESAEDWLR